MLWLLVLVLCADFAVAWLAHESENANKVPPNQSRKRWQLLQSQENPLPSGQLGPRASIGPSKSEIINSTWLYIPGLLPSVINGEIALWSGLYDEEHRDQGDALKIVFEGHAPRYMRRTCNADSGQWCMTPYVIHGCCLYQSPTAIAVDPNDRYLVEMHKSDGPGGLWHLSVKDITKEKKQLFSYVKGNAPATGFAVASEYTDGNGGTTDLQAYYNITLTLREPDPNFGKTAFTTSTVHMDRPITLDAGKSWFIRYIMIPPIAPQSSLTSRD